MSTTVQVKNSTKHIQLICVTGLFAAMIYVLTAWLHIPTGAGYTHAGDGLIYLAASMLPTPYAMAAGAIGAGLADLIGGYTVWVLPTIVIKSMWALIIGLFMVKLGKNNKIMPYGYKGDNCSLLFKKDREDNLREKSSRHYPCTCYMRGMLQSL